MPVRVAALVVTGAGGTGRTAALDRWIDDVDRATRSEPLVIRPRLRLPSVDDVRAWDLDAEPDAAVAVDDAELLDATVLAVVTELAERRAIGLVASPGPAADRLDALVDHLVAGSSAADPARVAHTGPIDAAAVQDWFGPEQVEPDVLVHVTRGNPALIAALVSHGWSGDLGAIATPTVDAITRRVRRLPDAAVDALRVASLGVTPTAAVRLAVTDDELTAAAIERLLSASGLVGDDLAVAPVVRAAVVADTTSSERMALADLVMPSVRSARDEIDGVDRAHLVVASSTATPVERTESALVLGRGDASAALASAEDAQDPDVRRLGFALDVRHLRLDRAVTRDHVVGAAATHVDVATHQVVATMLGQPTDAERPADAGVWAGVWWDGVDAMRRCLDGDAAAASAAAVRSADDAVRAGDPPMVGMSASALTAMLLLQVGRPEQAHEIAGRATRRHHDGPGESRTADLLESIASMQLGEFSSGLDAVRAGEFDGDQTRDQLLVAASQALVARRSGDTARLRDAWRAGRRLIDRCAVTWLLFDQFVDLAATGARAGDVEIADQLVDRLVAQLDRLPGAGPAPVLSLWARLQVDLSAERWDLVAVDAAADHLAVDRSADPRSTARLLARSAWTLIARTRVEPGVVGATTLRSAAMDAARALAAVGDGWEASRVLGQAALDDPDPTQARRLLETARELSTEPVDSADGLVAAGLSEREAEVSRLVAEGRTYKEIGSQLFISPKTVEHHVAKIRQRLGVTSRAELLATIKELAGS